MIWEYLVREVHDASTSGETATLNISGMDGWELVSVTEEISRRPGYMASVAGTEKQVSHGPAQPIGDAPRCGERVEPAPPLTPVEDAAMDAIDMLPEEVKRDMIAVRSMIAMINCLGHRDPKTARDLGNRVSQAMERIADWESSNQREAERISLAALEAQHGPEERPDWSILQNIISRE